MQEKTVTVELPESAFRRLKRASELTYRSVDEILVSAIDAALIAPPNLPIELAEELGALNLLSDAALLATAQPSFSPAEQYRLQQLNHSAGERVLTEAETTEQETLLQSYYRSMLRRAQSLAILAQRGHQVDPLQPLTQP
jgi:uncharacterized protein YnzC (UPF0291/DUF896 family)